MITQSRPAQHLQSARQESFDTLKFFLAFFIIVIHTGFTGYMGLWIRAIARIAVPLFFMITGYYLPIMPDGKFKKHFYKILYLTVITTLFYILFGYVDSIVCGNSFDSFLHTFDMKTICYWVLFNSTPPVAGHLWYFYALLYVLIIIHVARRLKIMSLLYAFLPLLLLGNYILSYFSFLAYRNFLFTGLPYVLLGCLFRNKENQLVNMFRASRALIFGLITLCIAIGIEMFIYKSIGAMVVRDHYLLTLPMVACIFILAIRHPHWGAGSFFNKMGRKYAAYIYITHPFIISLLSYGLSFILGDEIYQSILQCDLFKNSYPFLVFATTLLAVFVGNKLWTLLLQKRN